VGWEGEKKAGEEGVVKEEDSLLVTRLILVLQWRRDVEEGEMIERLPSATNPGAYRKDYLSFASEISQRDLDRLTQAANLAFGCLGLTLQVENTMGEIHPS